MQCCKSVCLQIAMQKKVTAEWTRFALTHRHLFDHTLSVFSVCSDFGQCPVRVNYCGHPHTVFSLPLNLCIMLINLLSARRMCLCVSLFLLSWLEIVVVLVAVSSGATRVGSWAHCPCSSSIWVTWAALSCLVSCPLHWLAIHTLPSSFWWSPNERCPLRGFS